MKIGIIGLGDMGKLFAKQWANAGYEVYGSDIPEKTDQLRTELAPFLISVLDDGVAVSRFCDFIMYAVEAKNLEKVVALYGPSTKYNAIVGGQTSVKTPEETIFKTYLPKDTKLVTSHALFGPHVNPKGQTLAVINLNASDEVFNKAVEIYKAIGATIEIIESVEKHDRMMADIQAVTHIGFESIGTACMHRKVYPWEDALHPNGLDNVKFLMTLRIFSYKPHVYSGLALLNPYAKQDVRCYAQQENELFGLMITENETDFRAKIYKARDAVFKDHTTLLMLDDSIMNEYSLNQEKGHKANSHLSLLSMVCSWEALGTNPYSNLICKTPPFKLRVGMAEYLFLNEKLLEESILAALYDKTIRQDDLAFHTAVHEWANIIETGDEQSYYAHFEATQAYLKERLEEGRSKSSLLFAKLN